MPDAMSHKIGDRGLGLSLCQPKDRTPCVIAYCIVATASIIIVSVQGSDLFLLTDAFEDSPE